MRYLVAVLSVFLSLPYNLPTANPTPSARHLDLERLRLLLGISEGCRLRIPDHLLPERRGHQRDGRNRDRDSGKSVMYANGSEWAYLRADRLHDSLAKVGYTR